MFKNLLWSLFFKNDAEFVLSKLDLDERLKQVEEKIEIHKDTISKLKLTIDAQEKTIVDLKATKEDEVELETYWNNRYMRGSIVYKGRSLPFTDIGCFIPVSVLITAKDPIIIEDLNKWELNQLQIPNLKLNEDYETLIPKIYKKIEDVYYKYEVDKNVWGKPEVWEFPFELRAKGFKTGFDCDSWAIFQASYYIAAGLPRWRVRIVCGDAEFGGHATVYIFSLKDNRWHHLNSTYGKSFLTEISKYPLHEDAENGKDKMGIKRVWFSFNDKYAWFKFADDIPNELELKGE